ncbi:ATP-binding cassette domain-containing protein [Castellaniella sp. WN]
MIEVNNLDVSIEGTPILRNISLVVPKGEMVGLVGRNGAGKTTLMRSIMGLARPDSGRIRIGQTDATAETGFWRARRHVGYMPEDRRLVPDLSVEENVLIPAWATHLEAPEQKLGAIYELMPEVRQFAPRLATSLSAILFR